MYYLYAPLVFSDTGGINGVLHRSILHLTGYWWSIRCTTTFYVTSPRILVVHMMYYNVLCYIPQGTGGVYGVLNRSMLHPPEYWWYITCCTTLFYVHPPGYWWYMW